MQLSQMQSCEQVSSSVSCHSMCRHTSHGRCLGFEQCKNLRGRASLVAQWLIIRLPMQGTRVQALVREDPTCRGAPKPVHHNY